jgi:hypothetical protein
MEFILTFHQPADIYEKHQKPETSVPILQAWQLYMDAMAAEGVLRGGARLNALAGSTVTERDGKREVQDGPFAETKDLLGGYVLLDVPSREEAVKWAARAPSTLVGSTSVWPVIPRPAQ